MPVETALATAEAIAGAPLRSLPVVNEVLTVRPYDGREAALMLEGKCR